MPVIDEGTHSMKLVSATIPLAIQEFVTFDLADKSFVFSEVEGSKHLAL